MTTARDRLKDALPFLILGVNMAKVQIPDGKVELAIVSKRPGGSGVVGASFECEEFFSDILEVLGYKDVNELVLELDEKDDK